MGASGSGAGPVPKTTSSSRPQANAPATPPSRPNLTKGGSRPNLNGGTSGMSMSGNFGAGVNPNQQPPKSNTLVFVLIAILLGAIGVLAYLVLTK